MKTLQLLTITALITTLGMSNLTAQEQSHDRTDNKRVTVSDKKDRESKHRDTKQDHRDVKKEHKNIKKKPKHEVKHNDRRVQEVKSHPPRMDKRPHGVKHTQMLQRGDRGSDVRELQRALKKRGFYRGHVDGIFGKGVERAVKRFQREHRLYADGIAGAETLRRLHVR